MNANNNASYRTVLKALVLHMRIHLTNVRVYNSLWLKSDEVRTQASAESQRVQGYWLPNDTSYREPRPCSQDHTHHQVVPSQPKVLTLRANVRLSSAEASGTPHTAFQTPDAGPWPAKGHSMATSHPENVLCPFRVKSTILPNMR